MCVSVGDLLLSLETNTCYHFSAGGTHKSLISQCGPWISTMPSVWDTSLKGSAQGWIIHCAGCTMGGGPRRQGAPADQLPNFYHAVLTFERSVYGTLKRNDD